jgi:hypothetical protein
MMSSDHVTEVDGRDDNTGDLKFTKVQRLWGTVDLVTLDHS